MKISVQSMIPMGVVVAIASWLSVTYIPASWIGIAGKGILLGIGITSFGIIGSLLSG